MNTRLCCNISSHGKDCLDEKKIMYVRCKIIEYSPPSGSEKQPEVWTKCVLAIDEKSRQLKKHLPSDSRANLRQHIRG